MVASVILFMSAFFPLLLLGKAYQQQARHAIRLRIWYGLFIFLLLYNWFTSTKIHLTSIVLYLSEKQEHSPYPLPPFNMKDQFISQNHNEPPLLSWAYVAYVIPLSIYTAESVYMLRLLRRATRYEGNPGGTDESFLD